MLENIKDDVSKYNIGTSSNPSWINGINNGDPIVTVTPNGYMQINSKDKTQKAIDVVRMLQDKNWVNDIEGCILTVVEEIAKLI